MKKAKLNVLISLGLMMIAVQLPAQTGMVTRTVISCRQAGTLTLSRAKTTVALAKEVTAELSEKANSPSYYVVFTPVDADVHVLMADKNDDSFSARIASSKNKTPVSVDYMVFVKETATVPDPHAVTQLRRALPGSK